MSHPNPISKSKTKCFLTNCIGSILVPQGLNEDEIENFIERYLCHLAIPIPFHILRNYSTFSNIKENIPLVVISDYQDDAAIPEDIVIDSKNYYYLGNIKAWIQSGGKIEYPKIINYQVIMNYKMENYLVL